MEFLWFLLVYAIVCIVKLKVLFMLDLVLDHWVTSWAPESYNKLPSSKWIFSYSKKKIQLSFLQSFLGIGAFWMSWDPVLCCPCVSLLQWGLELYASTCLSHLTSFSLAPLTRMFSALFVNCFIILHHVLSVISSHMIIHFCHLCCSAFLEIS